MTQEFTTMKAAYINATGPPSTIVYGELPKPKPGEGQVLVQVEAVDVNPIDTYVRGGMVAMPLTFPCILGCDLAGTVEAVGPNTRRIRVGDRVWGSNQGLLGRPGTFADYAAVEEDWHYGIPAGVEAQSAVAVALVGITAHLGLVGRARLSAGEWLFVNGGSGGVGSAVLQMAKAIGARVITTAGTDEKVALCRALGADLAINYRTEDVDGRIKEVAPKGVNVWWETLREPNFERAVSLLAANGRMVIMAGREARPPFPVGPFYVKGCSLFGFAMFNAAADVQRAAADDINRWLAEGKLKPRIDRILPLSEAAAAHQLQEDNTIGKAGTLAGKIVLVPE
jgi:NADPH2:quinone reductase